MKWCRLRDTADVDIFQVIETIDVDPTGLFDPSIVWESCPDEVQANWYKDNGTYREPTVNDEFIGWTNQEKKTFVKAHLDYEYWQRYSLHENPFNLGVAVYDGNDQATRIGQINDAKADRRAYIHNGEPPQDNTIDQVLASIGAYTNAVRAAYDAIWIDLKAQTIFYTDISTDPRWPAVPAFVGTADPDEPSITAG